MTRTLTIRYIVPIPTAPEFGRGWCRRKSARVLAGCYETAGQREVYVPEQIGRIEGIGGGEWDRETRKQLTAALYVRVAVPD